MIRKFSKGISPDRFDRFLRKYNLSGGFFAVNRRMVSRAVLIGVFFALIPVPGQMILVALTTALVRFNVAIALVFVWMTNPVTMPFIFFAEYELGRLLIMQEQHVEMALNMEWITAHYDQIIVPLYVGAVASATLFALVGYVLSEWLWVRSVRRDYATRRELI
jgi:uncharacterized protein